MPNYLQDIERLKKLNPILDELGVSADGYMTVIQIRNEVHTKIYDSLYDLEVSGDNVDKAFKLRRSDTLEDVLPDFIFEDDFQLPTQEFIPLTGESPVSPIRQYAKRLNLCVDTVAHIRGLWNRAKRTRGEEESNALADLIILLHENNIELKGVRDGE